MAGVPAEFTSKFGSLNGIKHKCNNEWSSSCPFCGGKDRFLMWEKDSRANARFYCRVCNIKGWFDEDISKEEITAAKLKRSEEKEKQMAEQDALISQLNSSDYWRGYHDGMSAAARQLWRNRGLPDEAQDYWSLGYVDDFNRSGGALSIPHFVPGWELRNIQYRILNTDGRGKYRYSPGIPASPFWGDPDESVVSTKLILTEGAIKAAVTFWKMAVESGMYQYNVASLPSKTPSSDFLDEMATRLYSSPYDEILLVLDPDAYVGDIKNSPARRIGDALGGRVRHVHLPGKIDDLLNSGLDPVGLKRNYLDRATIGVA